MPVLIYLISCLVSVYLTLAQSALAKTVTINNLKVVKVIDGDTIWVKNTSSKLFKVRLLGINAPELYTGSPEPYSLESTYYLKHILSDQIVTIKYETSNKIDKYNRILAHVYRENDNLWINLELIKLGLAYVYVVHRNILYIEDLIQAENLAIENKLNIWNHPKYLPINPENALNFINEYKIVIGKVSNIIKTKHNLWLVFENSNLIKDTILKYHTNSVLKSSKLFNPHHINLTVKVNYTFFKNNWETYIGKTVKVRGYIEQFNKNYVPFINLKSINTIEIL